MKKRRWRWLAWVMTLCMILTGSPANALQALAAGEKSLSPATVYYLWGNVDESGIVEDSVEVSDVQPEGKILIAKYVTDGIYEMQDGDEQIGMAFNNVTMSTDQLEDLPDGWALSGDTELAFANLTVYTFHELYSPYNGGIEGQEILSFYAEDPNGEDGRNPYNYVVTGNYSIRGFFDALDVTVIEGATLTLDVFYMEHDNVVDTETSGSYLNVASITVAGTVQFLEPEISDHNTGIEIHGDLFMQPTGSFLPYDGALIVFTNYASCDDSFAGNFYEADGATPFTFPATGWSDFYWSSGDEKWIIGQGGGGPEVGDYEFYVDYDARWDKDQPTAKVLVDGTYVEPNERIAFTPGETLSFSLQKPAESVNDTPIVLIETNEVKVYATFLEGDANLPMSGDSFTFTPDSSAGFIVRVWWNEFEQFGHDRDESEFILRTNSDGGSIAVNVDVADNKKMVDPSNPNNVKRIYSKSQFAGDTKLTLTFTPNEERSLCNVNIWADNQESNYVTHDLGEKDLFLGEQNGFAENEGVYTYVLTNYELGYGYSVWAWFEDDNSQGMALEDNQYFVDYDECRDDDNVCHATVTVNNSGIPSRVNQSFTKDQKLSFTLHPFESRIGCRPIVHLNENKGQHYSSEENEVDAGNLITLTQSGDDYTFSYTPTSDKGFEVKVWWSEYDYFNGGDNEFTMETHQNGAGSIFVSPGTDKFRNEPGEGSTGVRRAYPVGIFDNDGTIRVSFLPEAGWHLDCVSLSIGERHFHYVTHESDDDRDTPILSEGSGFGLDDGTYYFELTDVPENHWISFNAEFREDAKGVTFNNQGEVKIEYRIGDEQEYKTLVRNDPDQNLEIPLSELGDAASLTLRLTPNGQNVTVYALDVDWRDGSADERSRVRLNDTLTFTIDRGSHKWDNSEVEIITWFCPCDGEYLFERRGDGDFYLSGGLKFDTLYDFSVNSPITFTVTGTYYCVVIRDDYGNWEILNGDGNTYQYVPTTNRGIRFEIYTDQETFEYDYVEVDHENGEFTAEYGMHTEPYEGQAGGTVSLDVTPLRSAVRGEWTKLVLQNAPLVHLTITPKAGYSYRIEQNGQDVTAAVMENGNVYDWNTSEPWNIARIEIWFEKSNQYSVDYDECFDGESIPHASVTVNNGPVAARVNQTFTENEDLHFVLHPHEARIGCTPIVEIRVRDSANTFYCSADGTDDEHKITLTPSGDDFTFTFTPTGKENFEVTVYWSDYDRFQHGEGEFTIETRYDGNGSIVMTPAPDHFMNESGQNNTGVRNVYSKNAFAEDGAKIRLALIPAQGYYLRGVRVNADQEYNYVNYNTDENGYIPILSQDSGFVLENGVYYYEVTGVPMFDWLYVHADFGPEPAGIKVTNAHDSIVEYKIGNAQDYTVLAQPSSNEDPEITRAQLGNAESVTLHVTSARDGYEIYGLNIVQYDVFNHEISNNYVYLDPDDTYVLQKGEGTWNSWTVKIVDWICPFDGEYVINQRGPGALSLLDNLEFGQFYDYTPGQPIQFQVVGSHYEVWIKPNEGEWTEVHEDNGIYSYQPEGNCGVEFVIFTTKEMHDFDFTWPQQEGDFTAEYGVCTPGDDDTVGGTVTPSPMPVQSISYWGRTRYILNGVTTLYLMIEPNEGCTYRVEENGVFVTDAVKANGNVYEWNVADHGQIPDLKIYFDKEEVKDPAVMKYALAEFTGKIGVAFQVQIPDWVLEDENAYAEFTKGGQKTRIKVANAATEVVGENVTVRRFTQYVVAKEYADVINFRLFDGEGNPIPLRGSTADFTGSGVNYSLKQYADYVMGHPDDYGADAVELMEALEQYCNAARIHFQYNDEGLVRNAALDAVTQSSFGNCDPVITGSVPAGITGRNMKVAFESDNALKVFFTYADGVNPEDYEYYVDGHRVYVSKDGDEYYIAARNIPAKYLDLPHAFTVTDGTDNCTMQLSVMTYAKLLIGASGYSETEKDLGRVLYLYNQAAKKYFKIAETN